MKVGQNGGLGRGDAFLCGGLLLLSALVGSGVVSAPAHAAFPGTNSKLVCVGAMDRAAERDDTEIYAMNPDGSGTTFLTNNGPLFDPFDASPTATLVNEDFPSVSPNSEKIAFESYRSGSSEIWSANFDGSGPTRLTEAPGADTPGSYSPDGSQITFDSERVPQRGRYDVYKMNADGSNQTRLTSDPGHDSSPDWSPDGTRIAFHSDRDAVPGRLNYEIYTMNVDGGDLRRLTFSDSPPGATFPANLIGFDFLPRWSPDSKKIVFRSYRDNDSEIYTMNAADGSNVTRLTNSPGLDDEPAWSPDGTKIVFDSTRSGDREVYTMNAADGSDVTRLTNNPKFDGRCDWSRIPPPAPAPAGPPTPPVDPVPAQSSVPTPSSGKLKTSLRLKATPQRDATLPFKYTFSGAVLIPAGVSKAKNCSGRVRLTLKKGRKTVARSTAKVSSRCTYKIGLTIRDTQNTGPRMGKLKVLAQFGGNSMLKSSKKSTTVGVF